MTRGKTKPSKIQLVMLSMVDGMEFKSAKVKSKNDKNINIKDRLAPISKIDKNNEQGQGEMQGEPETLSKEQLLNRCSCTVHTVPLTKGPVWESELLFSNADDQYIDLLELKNSTKLSQTSHIRKITTSRAKYLTAQVKDTEFAIFLVFPLESDLDFTDEMREAFKIIKTIDFEILTELEKNLQTAIRSLGSPQKPDDEFVTVEEDMDSPDKPQISMDLKEQVYTSAVNC